VFVLKIFIFDVLEWKNFSVWLFVVLHISVPFASLTKIDLSALRLLMMMCLWYFSSFFSQSSVCSWHDGCRCVDFSLEFSWKDKWESKEGEIRDEGVKFRRLDWEQEGYLTFSWDILQRHVTHKLLGLCYSSNLWILFQNSHLNGPHIDRLWHVQVVCLHVYRTKLK
jgi:hypothetical protein